MKERATKSSVPIDAIAINMTGLSDEAYHRLATVFLDKRLENRINAYVHACGKLVQSAKLCGIDLSLYQINFVIGEPKQIGIPLSDHPNYLTV